MFTARKSECVAESDPRIYGFHPACSPDEWLLSGSAGRASHWELNSSLPSALQALQFNPALPQGDGLR
ncbi:hypothetical protein Ddc_09988 [Ditylenchus destructor]|nr:hypothetical protein Ddc_09988 [Ditylenchus destructor]